MVVGVLRVRLAIFEAWSLKDKRRVVKSLKDRLSGRHNVSVAEVADLERHQAATLGVVMIGNESRFVTSALSKILDQVRAHPGASLIEHEIELL
jgi:uncharacterized protein YlxP (DUF503 family)